MNYDDVISLLPMTIPNSRLSSTYRFIDSAVDRLLIAGIPQIVAGEQFYSLYIDLISRMIQPEITGYYNVSQSFTKMINEDITMLSCHFLLEEQDA